MGSAIGLVIAAGREPAVLWLGLVGVGCAYFYQAPPLRLSYRGLGELTVALCYGPLIAAGTYLVQRGTVSLEVVLVSLPLGLLIAAFLWINEFPDYGADLSARKRTLVVQLGRRAASRVFVLAIAAAFGLLALLPLFGLPPAVCLGGSRAAHRRRGGPAAHRGPRDDRPGDPRPGLALLSFLLLSAGTSAGLLLF